MSLAAAIAADRTRGGAACSTNLVREALPASDQVELDIALADGAVTTATIARALGTLGHRISAGALQRHRRGDCTCEPR